MSNCVRVNKGNGGWGKGLTIETSEEKDIILSVTGGGIHPVAERIAELTGGKAVDGFKNNVKDSRVAAAVIDCGGTARIGVYPMKGILTVDLLPTSPSGPLAKHINEDNFVSGVKVSNIELIENSEEKSSATKISESENDSSDNLGNVETSNNQSVESQKKESFLIKFSKGIGNVTGTFYQAGRESIDMLIKNILPFMAFISMLIGIINYTGIGQWLAKLMTPLAGSLIGLLILVFICTIPILSPVLGPGAVISQVIGVLIGTQIGAGNVPPEFALPALFAITGQVGADFIPVGLSLGEADEKTVEVGVPAVLYSRMITGVLAVIIAYFASFGLY
ncbi:PTS glucitol/sorbitol transporter subunit IIB [Staphylococcus gallinarum]|nr:PTS glucitol/sorbitol transporter subunit IIB [Staphylococcus gallinarum]MCD8899835.1 PTS glucitol/sorbitol transporter subunit IIB [Staphylococcus gallinarum]PTK90121.1 PTS sorbitol transporter subunit IIB [Staphylococcus gallinarum]PTK95349.1 PTS sorbitol transporter subunit IIB [Staphylococcus gallinarum]RIO91243.1 PTS sorbitol transporter subunit IIB [Staphylococcus gallinarum]